MDVHVIGLAADTSPQKHSEEEEKVSSSNQRMRLLGTLLRPPVVRIPIFRISDIQRQSSFNLSRVCTMKTRLVLIEYLYTLFYKYIHIIHIIHQTPSGPTREVSPRPHEQESPSLSKSKLCLRRKRWIGIGMI